MEMYGGLGDTKSFGIMPGKQEHFLAPVIMWHVYNVMLHILFAIGLIDASDKYLSRAASMARSFTFPWSIRTFEFLPPAEQR